jgi:S1-C subfamily serine protease
MKRTVVATALLACGFLVGLVMADRMSRSEPVVSASPQVRAAALPDVLPDLTAVADRAVLAAANISSRSTRAVRPDPFFELFFGRGGSQSILQQSLGSGVIVSTDGYVLTNYHVIGAGNAEVTVTLPDNRDLPARIIGLDERTDLAVLKVDATGLSPLPWGDSSTLRLAQWVLAVGNPYALDHSISLGIVSAIGRRSPDLSVYTDFIQTDAAINPGNSGGALVNARGELVGINSAIKTETGGYQGISFAIPSNLARRIMDELVDKGTVQWGAFDGVRIEQLTRGLANRVGYDSTDAVIVMEIWPDAAAYLAGLRPGDVITAFNDERISDIRQFERVLADAAVGQRATLTLVRREGSGRRQLSVVVPVISIQDVRQR